MQQGPPLIVASRIDPASLNIAHNLIHHHRFELQESGEDSHLYQTGEVQLAIVEKECIYLQPQDLPVNPGTIVFASKHRSSTQTPALTVHATGNLTREA